MSEQIKEMIGKVYDYVEVNEDNTELLFGQYCENDEKVRFFHEDDCCERVYISDIIGDLKDLWDAPILKAEVRCYQPELETAEYKEAQDFFRNREEDYCDRTESITWTFYEFATIKGSVTIRWVGGSNGYYSERVTMQLTRQFFAEGEPQDE